MADICPTAWLFRKPLIQIQHPGPKLKLGKKKKVLIRRKHTMIISIW